MTLPASIAAYGWVPFAAILVLVFFFSVAFIRYYQSRAELEISTSIIAVLSLTTALATSALLPIDVFLVSWMKNRNGTFQEWAANVTDRNAMEDDVMDTYYALYGAITVLAFMILPFAYFYHEERDDDRPWRPRFFQALKYSVGFVFLAAVILMLGAFIPLNGYPNLNGTYLEKLEDLVKGVERNGGEDAISFMISIVCLIGIVFNVIYTGYGMGGWPVQLLKGSSTARRDYEDVVTRRTEIRREYESPSSRSSARGRDIAETERLLARQERELEAPARSRLRACLGVAWRPLEVLLGLVLLLLGGLIFISLLLTNIDKAVHGRMRLAYLVPYPNRTLPNPVDWLLVKSQVVFPLDFILYACIVVFLIFGTIMAVRSLGIRCLCIKLFKIRPRATRPQGILFLCFILIFAILGLNVVCYFLTPQYSTFGSEHYLAYTKESEHGDLYSMTTFLSPCEEAAAEDCVMTRNSYFLVRYFFKAWFFGACYYWFSWGILVMYLIGLIHSLVLRRRTAVDDAEDDYDELE